MKQLLNKSSKLSISTNSQRVRILSKEQAYIKKFKQSVAYERMPDSAALTLYALGKKDLSLCGDVEKNPGPSKRMKLSPRNNVVSKLLADQIRDQDDRILGLQDAMRAKAHEYEERLSDLIEDRPEQKEDKLLDLLNDRDYVIFNFEDFRPVTHRKIGIILCVLYLFLIAYFGNFVKQSEGRVSLLKRGDSHMGVQRLAHPIALLSSYMEKGYYDKNFEVVSKSAIQRDLLIMYEKTYVAYWFPDAAFTWNWYVGNFYELRVMEPAVFVDYYDCPAMSLSTYLVWRSSMTLGAVIKHDTEYWFGFSGRDYEIQFDTTAIAAQLIVAFGLLFVCISNKVVLTDADDDHGIDEDGRTDSLRMMKIDHEDPIKAVATYSTYLSWSGIPIYIWYIDTDVFSAEKLSQILGPHVNVPGADTQTFKKRAETYLSKDHKTNVNRYDALREQSIDDATVRVACIFHALRKKKIGSSLSWLDFG